MGFSQTDFAALAGAKKGTQISWEKDASSPNAIALVAFAEAGADALYILTGRRTTDRPDNAQHQVEDQLAEIRRDILDPSRRRLPEEDEHKAEERVLRTRANALKAILNFDSKLISKDLLEEAEHLLDIVENPASLSLYRAADRVQLRRKRDDIKRSLREWLDGNEYQPDEAVTYLLTTIAMEYGVPVKLLAELIYEVQRDMGGSAASA